MPACGAVSVSRVPLVTWRAPLAQQLHAVTGPLTPSARPPGPLHHHHHQFTIQSSLSRSISCVRAYFLAHHHHHLHVDTHGTRKVYNKNSVHSMCDDCRTTRDAHIEFNGPAKIHSNTPTATEEKPIHHTPELL